MDRFNILLNRYLDNTASDQEVEEFMRLVDDQEHQHSLEMAMNETLGAEYAEPGFYGQTAQISS
jgi:hypothetical protein